MCGGSQRLFDDVIGQADSEGGQRCHGCGKGFGGELRRETSEVHSYDSLSLLVCQRLPSEPTC